jgi:hypothetical protein
MIFYLKEKACTDIGPKLIFEISSDFPLEQTVCYQHEILFYIASYIHFIIWSEIYISTYDKLTMAGYICDFILI